LTLLEKESIKAKKFTRIENCESEPREPGGRETDMDTTNETESGGDWFLATFRCCIEKAVSTYPRRSRAW